MAGTGCQEKEGTMGLVRWRPMRYYPTSRDDMDRAFNRMVTDWLGPSMYSEYDWNPSVDVAETDAEIVVTADLPGVKKDDVDVTVDQNQLVISGERKQEEEESDKNYYRLERRYGSFRRAFVLPANADAERVKAAYKDGVLTVTIPKTEVSKGKKVNIQG
jgi:HSP20 family protein